MIRAILIIIFCLSSCAYVEYGRLPSTIKTALIGVDDFIIDEEYFNSMEYSFIKVKTGKSGISVFVLANIVGKKYKWVSAEGETLTTLNEKIVQLESDSFSFSFLDFNPIKRFFESSINSEISSEYLLHLYTPKAFLVQQATLQKKLTQDEITLLGKVEQVDLYEESVITDSLSWNFSNKYWVDKNGMVLISEQIVHPFLDKKIGIEFYYKY